MRAVGLPRLRKASNAHNNRMANGQASGEYETFADGFAAMPPASVQPDRAVHRPVGLAQGPDGAIYITDDAGGRVYRITAAGGAR